MNPTVSIIMATYNRASYILESIQSIQNQTFKNFECLIIDDGGTDNTKEVISPILEQDNRFQYFVRTEKYQKGLPGTRNYGLDLANGDYIIFFDDDDIAHPQNLELCVKALSNDDVSFCRYIRNVFTGDFNYQFDYSETYSSFYIDRTDINKILKNELQFNSCAVMWTKACFANQRYTEHLKYAEEWEVYARVITSVNKGVSINKTLYYGRKHIGSSITGDFGIKKAASLKSYTDAIELVLHNLKKQHLVSDEIIRYFIQIALDYKPYHLFNRIMNILELPFLQRLKWKLFYWHLPIRLIFYKRYKKLVRQIVL
jgi:GalNAc5-diNAcBac-PP-undecaprenol beta-1,3-glucosyltransferase